MAFCGKCGANVQDGVAFCARCGTPIAVGQAPAPQHYQAPPPPQYQQAPGAPPMQYQQPGVVAAPAAGLDENVAGALAYVLGWVTGIIFLIIDKRPSVRFNAAQAIVVFGGIQVLQIVIGVVTGGGMFFSGFGGWGFGPEFGARMMLIMLGGLINMALWLVGLILWIVLMLKAYQRQPFRVPIAAGIADSLMGKSA
ncbi:MAG: zinc-ribbon domain-containing protein [Candidatus Acidiferrales bacterium]